MTAAIMPVREIRNLHTLGSAADLVVHSALRDCRSSRAIRGASKANHTSLKAKQKVR